MRHILSFCVQLVFASASFAAVTITSVSPSGGPTTGGTEVIIRGTEFGEIIGSPPQPPGVSFGLTPATNVVLVDETTIRVITPAHLPGVVDVSVQATFGGATLPNAFTFAGDPGDDHFERLLLPILLPPVQGAFGSLFHTELRMDSSRHTLRRVELYGLKKVCPAPPVQCPTRDPMAPLILPNSDVGPVEVERSGTPGRFAYVPESQLDRLTMNLRVRDVSREASNFGTELPIVRERDFLHGRIVLLGVPTDPRFRNTLRIYGAINWSVRVTVEGQEPVDILLSTPRDIFEPAYAVFTQFPAGTDPVTVTIEPTPNNLPVVPPPFWAFVAVTNNDTQLITTIVPQP